MCSGGLTRCILRAWGSQIRVQTRQPQHFRGSTTACNCSEPSTLRISIASNWHRSKQSVRLLRRPSLGKTPRNDMQEGTLRMSAACQMVQQQRQHMRSGHTIPALFVRAGFTGIEVIRVISNRLELYGRCSTFEKGPLFDDFVSSE
jgi:hypothetical protein